jgi:hypothetical protein
MTSVLLTYYAALAYSCVGLRNYKYFIMFVTTATALTTHVVVVCFWLIAREVRLIT